MRNDHTNHLAMLLVVFCCLGTTSMAVPTSTQTVLSVVVGGTSMHIVGELERLDFQFRNMDSTVRSITHKNPILSGFNLELQNLPPPAVR